MVSIHGPLGYGPSTLPLRHSAGGMYKEDSSIFSIGLYTGYAGLLNFDRAALITMGSWYYTLHGSLWEQTVFSLLFSKYGSNLQTVGEKKFFWGSKNQLWHLYFG